MVQVGCFGFNGPLRQYFSLYRASPKEREKKERNGGTGLIWTISISPYPSRLGKLLNALCLLLVTTQQVCKFTSAGGGHVFQICLRTIESCNQLGNCNIRLFQSMNVENQCSLSHC